MTTTIAQAIDEVVRARLLAERDAKDPILPGERVSMSRVRVTCTQVAEVLGEDPRSWSAWVSGSKAPALARVEKWADAAGRVLVYTPGLGWEATAKAIVDVDAVSVALQQMRSEWQTGRPHDAGAAADSEPS